MPLACTPCGLSYCAKAPFWARIFRLSTIFTLSFSGRTKILSDISGPRHKNCNTLAGRFRRTTASISLMINIQMISQNLHIITNTGISSYTISKSKMISRRQGGGDDAYCTYVEEADDAANKDSALIKKWYNYYPDCLPDICSIFTSIIIILSSSSSE